MTFQMDRVGSGRCGELGVHSTLEGVSIMMKLLVMAAVLLPGLGRVALSSEPATKATLDVYGAF